MSNTPRVDSSWGRHLALLGLCLWTLLVGASAPLMASPVEVSVDRIDAAVGDPITLTVRIQGQLTGEVKLPDLPDYVVLRGPTSRSVTNIVNFNVQRFLELAWTLTARRPGAFSIGPVMAVVDGKAAQSQPYSFEITIRAPGATTNTADIFAESDVYPRVAFPGQQVVYSFKLYRAVDVANYRYAPPRFDGFLEESIKEGTETKSTVTVAGRPYVLQEVRHILFPTRAGTLQIPEATLMAEVVADDNRRRRRTSDDPFEALFANPFGVRTEQREVVAPPIAVDVRALPEGAPEGFYGLVGDFAIDWQLSAAEVQRGASTTLTVDIEGTGNVRDIQAPTLSLPGFKVYEDTPQSQVAWDPRAARVLGKKRFKLALIPLQEGAQELPPITLSWYDPEAGRYRSAQPPPLRLTVTPGEVEEDVRSVSAPADRRQEVEVVGADILPLKQPRVLRPTRLLHPGDPLSLGLFLAPPLAFFGFLAWRRLKERDAADPAGRRRRHALTNAKAALKEAEANREPQAVLRQLDLALRTFLSDRLDLPGRALTPVEAREVVTAAGVSPARAEEVFLLLTELERAQYTRDDVDTARVVAWCKRAAALVDAVAREVR